MKAVFIEYVLVGVADGPATANDGLSRIALSESNPAPLRFRCNRMRCGWRWRKKSGCDLQQLGPCAQRRTGSWSVPVGGTSGTARRLPGRTPPSQPLRPCRCSGHATACAATSCWRTPLLSSKPRGGEFLLVVSDDGLRHQHGADVRAMLLENRFRGHPNNAPGAKAPARFEERAGRIALPAWQSPAPANFRWHR